MIDRDFKTREADLALFPISCVSCVLTWRLCRGLGVGERPSRVGRQRGGRFPVDGGGGGRGWSACGCGRCCRGSRAARSESGLERAVSPRGGDGVVGGGVVGVVGFLVMPRVWVVGLSWAHHLEGE